ncbi:Sex-determining transformer protein 1 [Smittium culicis]|uniref:Sex-determining transformer protein 1 n=1 Tax=Smittium culicis TaxID=133412 RepID=A0A1R1X6L4_9FUNG|nr:Sex-determining transformer protein 1 [Smittium culicis]OMJ14204.1 Sex-determining transformer protein 1 [Smittium culicis]
MAHSCNWGDCVNIFNNLGNLIEHLKVKHLHNARFCLWAGCNGYRLHPDLHSKSIQHIKAHLGEASFYCYAPNCKKSYKKLEGLLKHIQSHNQEFSDPEETTNINDFSDTQLTKKRSLTTQEFNSPEKSSFLNKKAKTINNTGSFVGTQNVLKLPDDILDSKESTEFNNHKDFVDSSKNLKKRASAFNRASFKDAKYTDSTLTKLTKVLEKRIQIALDSIRQIEENLSKNIDTELKLQLENQLLVDSINKE